MGGHSEVVFDAIDHRKYDVVGFIDEISNKQNIFNVPVIGNDDDIESLKSKGIEQAVVAVGHIGNWQVRDRLFIKIINSGITPLTVIHNFAIVSPYAKIGNGTVVLAGAIINAGAQIGENCIINSGAIIEHDVKIGNNVHIAPKVAVAGASVVGDNSFIGIGSSVIQGISIGKEVIIGAGSLVIRDINDGQIVCGVPTHSIKKESM